MSNLDAITKNLKSKAGNAPISLPDAPRKKNNKDEPCPQCGNRSMMKGFCVVCGYEAK